MSREERGRVGSGVIGMGSSAKDVEAVGVINHQPKELVGAVEGKVITKGSSAKWVKARRVK